MYRACGPTKENVVVYPTMNPTAAQIIELRICTPAVAPIYTPSHMNASVLISGMPISQILYFSAAMRTVVSLVMRANASSPQKA